MPKKKTKSDKPYNKCLTCDHREKMRCDGPRTSAMSLDRWCEFMRDMKEANGLTNSYIAEQSGVSLKTIERLMAQNSAQDIMRETARSIENAIIGSSNQYPCHLAYEETAPEDSRRLNDALRELERALENNRGYKEALDNIHASYNAEMQTIRDEAQRKIEYILAENARLRTECESWRAENERKGKIIDQYVIGIKGD